MADPCPHCGLPGAGVYSQEYAEYRAKVWDGKGYPFEYVNCEKCGLVNGANRTRVRTKVVKSEDGTYYKVHFEIQCPKCGGLIETVPGLI
jgi:uncharacterized Zn finger protein